MKLIEEGESGKSGLVKYDMFHVICKQIPVVTTTTLNLRSFFLEKRSERMVRCACAANPFLKMPPNETLRVACIDVISL